MGIKVVKVISTQNHKNHFDISCLKKVYLCTRFLNPYLTKHRKTYY